MNRIRLTTVLGIASIIVGLWWIGDEVRHLFFRPEEKPINYGFLFFMLPMIVPGIMAIYFGFHLTKERSKANIKGTVGILVFFTVLFMLSFVDGAIAILEETPGITGLSLLITSCVAIFCYVFLSKFLMKKEGFIPARGEFIGKGIATWIAFLVWLASSELADAVVPIGEIHPPEFGSTGIVLLGLLVRVLGPILLACVCYKYTLRYFHKNSEQDERANGSPPTSASPHTMPV